MKAFQFPLQAVMDWRGRTAEQERDSLERMHSVKRDVELRREAVLTEINHAHRAVGDAPMAAHDLLQLARYVNALQHRGHDMKREQDRCERDIESQRLKCIESSREFRLLERYRERRLGEWERALDAENESVATTSFLAKWVRESRTD